MLTHRHVAVAAEIGMLVREAQEVQARQEMLRLLNTALHGDAACLVAIDPFDGRHHRLAEVDYPPEVARSLTVEFTRTRWFDVVLTSELPQSISDEPSQSFRRGWFYERYMKPAGYRDGMTGALWRNGRYVGLLHLSSGRNGTFDTDLRRLLASVMPAFAAVADLVGRAADTADIRPADCAALVSRGRIVPMPDRDRPPVLLDPEFLRVVAEFQEAGGGRLRFLWPAGRAWHRVELVTAELPAPPPGAALVRTRPANVPYGLSGRELEVLTRLAMGCTSDVIAKELVLSPRTIHKHVEHVLQKTRTSSRTEAATLAVREGVLRPVPGLPGRAGVVTFLNRTHG
ncbi:MAG TPA: LuxR C-terminal-related transcriptional regulator [Spirillospora sp.]|mgnify:CR=1 FL=1